MQTGRGRKKLTRCLLGEETFPLKGMLSAGAAPGGTRKLPTSWVTDFSPASWIRCGSPFPTMPPIPGITAEVRKDTGQLIVTRRPLKRGQNWWGCVWCSVSTLWHKKIILSLFCLFLLSGVLAFVLAHTLSNESPRLLLWNWLHKYLYSS